MQRFWGKKGNYAYVCARIKAKKSLLLTKDVYPKLLMMDLNEIGRFLGETQYHVEMTELASRYSGVDLIELGTSRNLARIYSQIIGFSRGELREMICGYLGRWDEWNIKTILRGKYSGASIEEIQEDLVPAGRLGEDTLNTLLALETVEEVLEALRTKEGITIPEEVIAAYRESGTLEPLEEYFDKVYYSRLLASIRTNTKPGKLFLAFVQKEIDVTNLKTLLKLKRENVPPERCKGYFIDGGSELTIKELLRLASVENFDRLVEELAKFSFYEDIKEGLLIAKEKGSLIEVTLALQKYLVKQSETFSHIYPLSILPVLDYIIRKKIEVDNIRIIARGKESGLDIEVIKNLLVV
ncbi:MAG: ATP synthase A1 subunit C [Methanomassiliicoccales archaeon]|jgi:V/A-type H+-transporting ATPase subunit C|nr:ATP synthase A1 subunit C [Methanomassiliicoccales archaeon]